MEVCRTRWIAQLLFAIPIFLIAQVASTLPFVPTPTPEDDGLPAGPGKSTLVNTCGPGCHGPEMYAGQSRTRQAWESTMNTMADKGATPTDAQWTEILDYLSTYLGPAKLDMNKATASDMKTYLKITDVEAAAIVKYRAAHGGKIASLADLKKVDGLDAAKLDALKDYMGFLP